MRKSIDYNADGTVFSSKNFYKCKKNRYFNDDTDIDDPNEDNLVIEEEVKVNQPTRTQNQRPLQNDTQAG